VDISNVAKDEDRVFTDAFTQWSIDLNWRVLSHFAEYYSRPEHIRGFVQPLRLPKLY